MLILHTNNKNLFMPSKNFNKITKEIYFKVTRCDIFIIIIIDIK